MAGHDSHFANLLKGVCACGGGKRGGGGWTEYDRQLLSRYSAGDIISATTQAWRVSFHESRAWIREVAYARPEKCQCQTSGAGDVFGMQAHSPCLGLVRIVSDTAKLALN